MRREQRHGVTGAANGLRVYPDPADVFVADQQDLARYLHPLVSIDLNEVDDDWHGWIHLVSPVEPAQVCLGSFTKDFHSPLQVENWLGFAMEGDRYRLTGDLRFFAKATTPEELADPFPGFREEVDELYEVEERSYQAHRDMYRRDGELLRLSPDGTVMSGPNEVLDVLGGDPYEGNWFTTGDFPCETDDDGIWPISPAGNRFWYVAETPGWNYRNSGADSILLFFEPVQRLALLTFDWT